MTASGGGPRTPLKVLLVEDNPDQVVLARSRLALAGGAWEVENVETLAAAVERLSRGGIDAVLLDLQLPDARGLEAVNRLTADHPHVPLVVLTGHDDEAMGVVALQKGAQDYLVKTQVDRHTLDRALRYAIERMRAAEAAARWSALVEASRDAIFNVDALGQVTSWNPAAGRLYGFAADEVVGQPVARLAAPAAQPEISQVLGDVAHGGHVEDREMAHRGKDGSELRVRLTVHPIRGGAGRVTGATMIARAIS